MKNKNLRMILGISLNLILIVLGVFIIFSAGSKAYSFGRNIFDEQSVDTVANGRDVEVMISTGVTAKQLAHILYEKGLVKDEMICEYQIKLSEYNNKFVGGSYTLTTSMTPTEMMKVLTNSEQETTNQ